MADNQPYAKVDRPISSEMAPLVTVVAVCYNHARFLIECLESVRAQTYRTFQLIITDDCSTDDSQALIEKWRRESGVESIFIAHEKNAGLCKTLNEALACATGKYVSFVATDDQWLPNKLQSQVEYMELASERVGVLYSDAFQIDEEGHLLSEKFFESHRGPGEMPQGDVFGALLQGNFIPAMATLVRRQCYERLGGFDERLCYEDWDMWLRISQDYEFAFLPVIATKYRIVSTSLTRSVLHSQTSFSFTSDYLILAKCLEAARLTPAQEAMIRQKLIVLCHGNMTKQELALWLPRGSTVILIDENTMGGTIAPDRRAIPFLERDGQYWGTPANDETAIREFERLKTAGAEYLVFVAATFWWLGYYVRFSEYLESRFKCLVRNERLILFDLRIPALK